MQHVIRREVLRPTCRLNIAPVVRPRLSSTVQRRDLHIEQNSHELATPTQTTMINKHGTRTLRARKHGNQNLPVPAIMDPIAIEAKERHKHPKAKREDVAEEELTVFQKELATNPYARTLASPIRQCLLTKARLPSHFLVPFIAKMPTTEEFANKTAKPTLIPAINFKTTGQPSSYLLATEYAIKHLNQKKKWAMLINERMKRAHALRAQRHVDRIKPDKDWEWNRETPDLVVAQLRKNVARNLRWCLTFDGETASAANLESLVEKGVSLEGVVRVMRAQGNPEDSFDYDVKELLGPDWRTTLKENGVGDGTSIVLFRCRNSMITLQSLEKLQNYTRTKAEQ